MDPRIFPILPLISAPARYVGGEKNAVRKRPDDVRLRFALAFPDVYEVAMSHVGLDILYNILNTREDIAAERVFAPWPDMERHMRAKGLPLASIESSIPIQAFDILGFSLQYELSYTNVLNMLDLAGIPLWACDRKDGYPLVIAGGPGTSNPEPVADFFDAILVGDGEEAVVEICDTVLEAKQRRRSQRSLLDALSHIPGVYVPAFFRPAYDKTEKIGRIIPQRENYTHVTRRILPDLDRAPYPTAPVVPWVKTVHDRLSLEIARGCKRGCRFCHAGFIYRPYRERRPERVYSLIQEALDATGYEEVSFLSLSSGDYGCMEPLLHRVMDHCQRRNIALSFPSLRVETLKPEMLRQIRRVRKTGFTLAPEAATTRLRRVINKEMDEGILLEAARNLYREGWNLIKLYFMIGLPTETDEDVEEIIDLTRRVLQQGKGCRRPPRLNVSVSTFVPKPHTPFQWERQLTLSETEERQQILRRGLRKKGIRFKWHDARMSLLEGVFSRGDRRLSRVLQTAFTLGCRFDGWGELFQWALWCKAFENNQISMDSYIQGKALSETLPWAHIQSGVHDDFLRAERVRSREEKGTVTCRKECRACGLCHEQEVQVTSWETFDKTFRVPEALASGPTEPRRVRLTFEKVGPSRFIGHLDMTKAFHRAARRAGIRLRYSQGFHPTPRMSFARAQPLGLESLCEEMEWDLENGTDQDRLPESVNDQLPEGLRVTHVVDGSARRGIRPPEEDRDWYLVAFQEIPWETLELQIDAFLSHDQWVVPWNEKGGQRDLRSHVGMMRLVHRVQIDERTREVWEDVLDEKPCLMEIAFLNKQGEGLRVGKALGSILSLSDQQQKQLRILRFDKAHRHVQ
jgi:radical SAM family uncharacterized protein/radical SAM-linked protein